MATGPAGSILMKAIEIGADLLEPAMDAAIRLDYLKDLPGFGLVIKVAQASRSVSDFILLAKMEGFAEGMGEVDRAELAAFAAKIDAEPEFGKRIGKLLLGSLHAFNDFEKTPILGKIYRSFVLGEIGFDTVRRLSNAVNLAVVDDLTALYSAHPDSKVMTEEARADFVTSLHALRITGLASLEDTAFAFVGRNSYIGTAVAPLGTEFIRIMQSK